MITITEEADILASSLPNGLSWHNKYEPKNGETKSNLRKFLHVPPGQKEATIFTSSWCCQCCLHFVGLRLKVI